MLHTSHKWQIDLSTAIDVEFIGAVDIYVTPYLNHGVRQSAADACIDLE